MVASGSMNFSHIKIPLWPNACKYPVISFLIHACLLLVLLLVYERERERERARKRVYLNCVEIAEMNYDTTIVATNCTSCPISHSPSLEFVYSFRNPFDMNCKKKMQTIKDKCKTLLLAKIYFSFELKSA